MIGEFHQSSVSIQAQRGRSRASTSRPTQGRDREILSAALTSAKKQPFMVSAKTGFVAAPISYPHRASQTMASPLDRFDRPHPSPHLHEHEHTCTESERCTCVLSLWYVCSRGQGLTGPASGGSGDRDLHPASRQLTKHGTPTAQRARAADLDLPNGGNNLKLYTTTRSRNPLSDITRAIRFVFPRATVGVQKRRFM